MKITFWGTRGSVPVSGTSNTYFGGATTCISFEDTNTPSNAPLIIDSGTGIVQLGKQRPTLSKATIYQTHMHWDHIQGFPFFSPLFRATHTFDYCAVARGGECIKDVLSSQMTQPTFPIGLDIIPAQLNFHELPQEGSHQRGAWHVEWTEMIHPGGSTAFKIKLGDVCVVFSGDVEVRQGCKQRLIDFAKGADVLIMDAQYTEEEYQARVGFGHSTPNEAIEVAHHAQVSRLFLTHHDPHHDDRQLTNMLQMARQFAIDRRFDVNIDMARDGLAVECTKSMTPRNVWFQHCENPYTI